LQLDIGLAQCPRCGSTVGTLFSEKEVPASGRAVHRERVDNTINAFQSIEKARERGNNALVLALASFFCPIAGILIGIGSVLLGANALRTLKTYHIEEGRGPAWAAVVIGGLSLLAQVFVAIALVRQGTVFGP
jgi:hypothetical protein